MAGVKEQYLIFKGDDIVGVRHTLSDAKELFKSLPKPTRLSEEKAIYKLVKEEKRELK